MKSFLLAVRQYKPGEHCSSVEAGRLVQLWAEHALQEFGLDWTMVAGATTDSGSEVKFAFMDIPGVLREWCIPHMLNRAIIDAFGLSLDPKKSKNPDARKPILEVRRIVEHINKSDMAGVRRLMLVVSLGGRISSWARQHYGGSGFCFAAFLCCVSCTF